MSMTTTATMVTIKSDWFFTANSSIGHYDAIFGETVTWNPLHGSKKQALFPIATLLLPTKSLPFFCAAEIEGGVGEGESGSEAGC